MAEAEHHATPQAAPTWPEFLRLFGRIGLLSFGGPAAQISLMQTELVERHRLIAQRTFLSALSFCMLLPGPEAMQLATYAGWRLRGVPGGLVAGTLFVLPGAGVIAALAALYLAYGGVPWVTMIFAGIQVAVIAILIAALRGLACRALQTPRDKALACAAFAVLAGFGAPFPLIIAAGALIGACTGAARAAPAEARVAPIARKPWPGRSVGLLLCLWAVPLIALAASEGGFLTQVGPLFSKLAVVSFGGAYAVLAYMTQIVVSDLGWLAPHQMLDALALAETTPGPLILVTQFVAILAGHAAGGVWLAALAGALTLWVTFLPCFAAIFAGAPFVERLTAMPRLSAALSGVTAAVVGVIAHLALWFALHVLFGTVALWQAGPLALSLPKPDTLRPLALGGAVLCTWLALQRGWGPLALLCLGAGLGAASWLGGAAI